MKIFFRKILDYDLKKDKQHAFIYACKLLSQEINPHSLKKGKLVLLSRVALSSTLKRGTECIKKDKKTKLIQLEFLNEIPFNLKLFCNEKKYFKEGSVAVRRAFKQLFIQDRLIISRNKIFTEIKELLINIKNNYSAEKNITIVSHSFRLKCIEAYLKTQGRVVKKPKLLEKYISTTEKTFDFGQGFDFEI